LAGMNFVSEGRRFEGCFAIEVEPMDKHRRASIVLRCK
jgi:hypothetical protein